MNAKITTIQILLLQIVFFFGYTQSKELKFNLVEGHNGKPLGKITAITQDPHGYMWFCGQDEKCLYRYDGNKIVAYKHDDADSNSLAVPWVETVYADDQGMIWIGGNGLDQYNPATGIFKHYRKPRQRGISLTNNDVFTILKDHRGRLWIGTFNGLDCLDEKTGKSIHYGHEPGNPRSLSSNSILTIYEDHAGVIWIGTGVLWVPNEDGGLNRLNEDGTFTRYRHDPNNVHSLINNKVRAVFEDSKGIFWVGTHGDGLHTMDRSTGIFERHLYNPAKPEELSRSKVKHPGDHITFINEDNTGEIWIGTYAAGLNRYDPVTRKITQYKSSNGFPDSTSWNGFISKDGVLWISTEDSHLLYRVNPFYKPINSFADGNEVVNFLEDRNGYLWVATVGNGLLKYDQQKNLLKQYKNDPSNTFSLDDNGVLTLEQNQDDSIWVGTWSGIRILNTNTDQFLRFPDAGNLKDSAGGGFSNILKDKQGHLWFGRWGLGLTSYNPEDHSFKHFLSDSKGTTSISSNFITGLLEDKSGSLWVSGFTGGINRFNRQTGTFKYYLNEAKILCLYADSQGTLWAGTSKGLFSYNAHEDRFDNFFDPLSVMNSVPVLGIIEDNAKDLWLKSESSITKLNPVTKDIFIYARSFGIMPESVKYFGGMHKDKQGQLYIGFNKGFYNFFPEELAVKTNFKILLTGLFINTLPVLPGKGSPIQKPVEDIREANLTYNQNNLAFNFSAIDFREPGTIRYFTMLENYDNTWREAAGEKSAFYFNISPGHYLFRVKAYNTDGEKAEIAIAVLINPPWWRTTWAYSSYAALLIFTVVMFVNIRTKKLKEEKTVLEERVAERTRDLIKEKEIVDSTLSELKATQAQLIQSEKMASLGELTAGIAHEIQNPLNFVNNFSEVNAELVAELKAENQKPKADRDEKLEVALLNDIEENSKKINHHGKRAGDIVKGMLQHSRSGGGVKEPTDISALADEYLRLAYHGLRAKDKSFNAKFETNFDSSIPKINIIPQDIGRVILNLINNAFYVVTEKAKLNISGYEPMVMVSTIKNGDKIEIKVKDNGSGIPQKVMDKIFQPFFTTKPSGQGTGLGLSLSYDIVKAHGGEIKVETRSVEAVAKTGKSEEFSAEQTGSEFIITLPIK